MSSQNGFKKWQEEIDGTKTDSSWSKWDTHIKVTVNEYNRHLKVTTDYSPLDWQLIKAMLWVESGAKSKEWLARPMQIGVKNDPGLQAFFARNEGGDLIIPPVWKGKLTVTSAKSDAINNIRAGTGYLLMRMAIFGEKSVINNQSEIKEIKVESGDTLYRIAQNNNSTIAALQELNPGINTLRPGQVLKVRSASIQLYIKSWRPLTTSTVTTRYNGGSDSLYTRKLDYALKAIKAGRAKS